MDQTIVATAIPKISDHFRALNDVGWYASAFFLTTYTHLHFGMLIVERPYNRHSENYIKYLTSNTSSSSQSQSSKAPPPLPTAYLIVSRFANLCPGTYLCSTHCRTCDSRCRRRGDLFGSLHYHLICCPPSSTTNVLCGGRRRQRCCLGGRSSCGRCFYPTCFLAMVFLYQFTNWSHHHRYYCVPPPRAATEIIIPPSQREVQRT